MECSAQNTEETKPKIKKSVRFNVPSQPSTPERILQPPPPPLAYEKPLWSGLLPQDKYAFEVIKEGVSLDIIQIPFREFIVLGRLPTCDIIMDHPSISRHHAILQFKDNGEIYIYDLDSVHGSILNRSPVPARSYTRVRVGDQLRFGESSRIYILQGPEDEDFGEQLINTHPISQQKQKSIPEETGVTWGFSEDADAESEMPETSIDTWKRDENAYYYKDPRKALRNWFDNCGIDMEFEIEEQGPVHARTFTARVQLPDVEDAYGPVYGLGSSSKKRDAEKQAAIDACEKLDMYGALRGGHDETAIRKRRLRRLLGKDEDETDSFYDRTNSSERNKSRKSQKSPSQKVETYESLTQRRKELVIQIADLRHRISEINHSDKMIPSNLDDDFDIYMNKLQQNLSGESKSDLELALEEMMKQDQRLSKLIDITKPADILQDHLFSTSLKVSSKSKSRQDDVIEELSDIQNSAPKTLNVSSTSKFSDSLSQQPEDRDSFSSIERKTKREPPEIAEFFDKGKRAKIMAPMTPKEYEDQQIEMNNEIEEFDIEAEDDITAWDPPQGQTGDGRTALNDKFGY